MGRVLVLGADADTERWLFGCLRQGNFLPDSAATLPSAMERLGASDALLIADAPPRFDGLSACQAVRAVSFIPLVLALSAADDDRLVRCLEQGADDAVCLPCPEPLLTARFRALLRGRTVYSASDAPAPIRVGPLTVDPRRREASLGDRKLALTRKEYSILEYLAVRAGESVERDRMFEDIWGYDAALSGKLLEVHIRRLRAKIEPDPCRPTYLHTVRGYGYRLTGEDKADPAAA